MSINIRVRAARDPNELLTLADVCKVVPVKARTIKAWVRTGKFPRPKKAGERLRLWVWSEVAEWINALDREHEQ